MHSTDVWVAQLGVPVDVDIWSSGGMADSSAGLQRATPSIPLAEIRPYTIDVGNNGLLSDTGSYWTTEADLERLFTHTIPETATSWKKRRVMLYLHGGLNDETEAAKRVIAFKDVCLKNEIYPLHVMWETGARETLRNILADFVTDADERASGWMKDFRDHLIEAKDRTFELTVSRPGTSMWNEMKENARLASERRDERGAMQLLVRHAGRALEQLSGANRSQWEVHIVAHSAGSILVAYALERLMRLGVTLKTISFLAPAITTALFKQRMLPAIRAKKCPQPTLFNLSDDGERDDNVGPYGKSLLYLVSNAFEGRRDTPLLGMQRFLEKLDQQNPPDAELESLFRSPSDGLRSLVIAGTDLGPKSECRSDSHGGFDNDPATLNAVLTRILGHAPVRPFEVRDLQ